MQFLRLLLTALATLVLALFVGSNGLASAQPPPCGAVTMDITLSGDCTGQMDVVVSNITIDLNGFAIVNSGSEGINIVSQTNVRVKNGAVTGSAVNGVRIVFGGGGHRLEDLEITNNGCFGIVIETGDDSNRVKDNTISGNGCAGLIVLSDGNRITRNEVNNNTGGGIFLIVAQNNRIRHNTALGNGEVDLLDGTEACDNNRWKHNTFDTANPSTCIQ